MSKTILDKAAEAVDGPRRAAYGHPKVNHRATADLWTTYLNRAGVVGQITPRMVCMMNALQKIARDANHPYEDNLIDLAGWARNAEIVDEEEGPKVSSHHPGCSREP